MPKSATRSKTLIANVVALGIALYQYYVGPIFPADPWVFGLAVSAINIGLRFKTTQPVALITH